MELGINAPVTRTLVVRLDGMGDVLVTGPAIRALARGSDHLTLLAGPSGRGVAELLPGVDEVLCWQAPWIDPNPQPVRRLDVEELRVEVAEHGFDRGVIFTSPHQSALPTALVLRMAGVPWVGAISEDYAGSLLDVRHWVADDVPEPERALSLAVACGDSLAPGDSGGLAIRSTDTASLPIGLEQPFVVLHPGTSVSAHAWPPEQFHRASELLVSQGHRVVVTGAFAERTLTSRVAEPAGAIDLGGRTTVRKLAAVLEQAEVVVAGNAGSAHLAAAVGTPVVTVAGHPCLASMTAEEVVSAVRSLSEPADPTRESGAWSRGSGSEQSGHRS